MASTFKSRFWRTSRWFLALFILLFVFRIIYGYVAKDAGRSTDFGSDFFSSLGNVRKNYASEKFSKGMDVQLAQPSASSSQKFEKTASIKTKTAEFEQDDKLIKSKTKGYNAVIQYEQKLGQKGSRQLHLLIGVNPELFDSFYIDIQKIGTVKATEITKVDKTNEYRQLNAKKVSIENTLRSLNELKSKGGQITDFISLNEKILEVEEKLQEMGVELGNFDTENEFCTVKLSLYEGAAEKNISIIHRVKVALEWTIKYFTLIVVAVLAVSLTVFLLLLIADKLNIIKSIANKVNE
jgi:hypothetical protein